MKARKFLQEITKQSEILTFGKYKHKTIQYVLRIDPSYILWLNREDVVKFPQEILDLAYDYDADSYSYDEDYGEYSELHYGDR